MTRVSMLGVLVLVATCAGCVGKQPPSRPIFYKPGITSSQVEADEARCLVQSIGGGTEFKPVVAIDREAVYKCMEAHGYQVTRPRIAS